MNALTDAAQPPSGTSRNIAGRMCPESIAIKPANVSPPVSVATRRLPWHRSKRLTPAFRQSVYGFEALLDGGFGQGDISLTQVDMIYRQFVRY